MSKNDQPMQEQTKLWNKSYIMILVLSTFIHSASYMVTPFITKFALCLGAPLTIATTIASLLSVSALILRPFAGRTADRFNRKTIILIANTVTMICILCLARVKTVNALVVVRLIHGIAFSFTGVAMMAFNTMFIPKDRLGEGMGWMALSTIVSQSVGPNLGMWIVEHFDYSMTFFAAAGVTLIGIIIFCFIPYSRSQRVEKGKFDINDFISIRLIPYALLLCLFSSGNGLITSMLVVYGEHKGIENVSMFFTAYSIVMFLVRPFSGKLVDRKGLRIVLYPSLLIAAVGFLVLGNATNLVMVIIAGVLKAIGQGSGSPAIQSTSLKMIGREKAGVVSSTCYIGADVGNAVAPILGGYVAEHYGYEIMFNGYAVILFVVGTIVFTLKWKHDYKKYGVMC
ncbi:MAG: MFS transporter [Oscillospiraceae bacterium]|nr:MFS transporter [Oscillospiraceae bacterium]